MPIGKVRYVIVLFTDFGPAGPYQAQLHAALYMAGAHGPVIDLHADLACYNPRSAAYLLAAYVEIFPPGTVFLCVVDPGVGSAQRRPLAVHCAQRWFVGPDNGLFEVLPARFGAVRAAQIVWQPEKLSATFHGRDLFAPIAAHLSRNEREGLQALPRWPEGPAWAADLAEVIYIDHYGNVYTGLRAAALPRATVIRCNGHALSWARTYSDVEPGRAFWYENSIGLVEFAVNQGNASAYLQTAVGNLLELST